MAPVIEIRGISKCYHLGQNAQMYSSFREALARGIASVFKPLASSAVQRHELRTAFWALREVSVDIAQGEILGVLGSNGAGKSTLLKIISRITDPTAGHIRVRGRMGSLLEVG